MSKLIKNQLLPGQVQFASASRLSCSQVWCELSSLGGKKKMPGWLGSTVSAFYGPSWTYMPVNAFPGQQPFQDLFLCDCCLCSPFHFLIWTQALVWQEAVSPCWRHPLLLLLHAIGQAAPRWVALCWKLLLFTINQKTCFYLKCYLAPRVSLVSVREVSISLWLLPCPIKVFSSTSIPLLRYLFIESLDCLEIS